MSEGENRHRLPSVERSVRGSSQPSKLSPRMQAMKKADTKIHHMSLIWSLLAWWESTAFQQLGSSTRNWEPLRIVGLCGSRTGLHAMFSLLGFTRFVVFGWFKLWTGGGRGSSIKGATAVGMNDKRHSMPTLSEYLTFPQWEKLQIDVCHPPYIAETIRTISLQVLFIIESPCVSPTY